MFSLKLFLVYFTVPCIIANDITILTDWKKTTLQCMNKYFANSKYKTNVTIFGLDEKGESVVHNIIPRNINELIYQYHLTDYLTQGRGQEYYSKLIHTLAPLKYQYILFGEKSDFNDSEFLKLLNDKQIKIVWCKNGECESCEEQKPKALAIVNQIPENKNDFSEQIQSKNKASDKFWSEEVMDGPKSFTLELSPYSVLTADSGETVKLYFRVINTHWIPLEYNFHCDDQMGLIRSVLPTSIILPPNSAPFDVTVVLEATGPEGSIDQISFSVLQPEFMTLKVNFYIGKLTGDTTRPIISYIFNGDCRFADSPHTCASEKWSIEATIQDQNSGLAMVSSIPNNLRFRNEFSIGTREPVIVYYTATCCFPKVEIIATNLRGSMLKKTIDAEKQYLNMSEIALIILSLIILLIFISFLIFLIIRCQKKKRSQDFLSN